MKTMVNIALPKGSFMYRAALVGAAWSGGGAYFTAPAFAVRCRGLHGMLSADDFSVASQCDFERFGEISGSFEIFCQTGRTVENRKFRCKQSRTAKTWFNSINVKIS